jgi:hypothetical protein
VIVNVYHNRAICCDSRSEQGRGSYWTATDKPSALLESLPIVGGCRNDKRKALPVLLFVVMGAVDDSVRACPLSHCRRGAGRTEVRVNAALASVRCTRIRTTIDHILLLCAHAFHSRVHRSWWIYTISRGCQLPRLGLRRLLRIQEEHKAAFALICARNVI